MATVLELFCNTIVADPVAFPQGLTHLIGALESTKRRPRCLQPQA